MVCSTDAGKKYAAYLSVTVALGAAVGIIGYFVSNGGDDNSFGKATSKYMGQVGMTRSIARPSMLSPLSKPVFGGPFKQPLLAARAKSIVDIVPIRQATPLMMATPNAAPVYDGKYAAELRETAAAMVKPGKGLLACDESTGTVGTRLESIGLENNEDNRRIWRNLLFTTEGIGEYVSGPILFEETLYQDDPDGKPFVDVMKANGIIPGIKVDKV